MIYLINTTDFQEIYIPRQSIQTATTRDVDYSIFTTSAQVETMIDSALTEYSTTEEMNSVVDSAFTSGITWVQDQHYLTEHQGLDNYYTSAQTEQRISESYSSAITSAITWVENQHYLTEHQSLDDYALSANTDALVASAVTDVKEWVNEQGFITEHQSLDDYYSKEETNSLLSDKQDTLVSGTNIKTINNESVLGEGNIQIDGKVYSAGTNIEIDQDNFISVTGLDIYATSGELLEVTEVTSRALNELEVNIDSISAQTDALVESAYTKAVTSATTWTSQQGYLTQHQSLAGLAASVNYDSNAKKIYFYDKDNNQLSTYVDTTDFIKDGMVANVYISGSSLVIVFNTDAGKENIVLDLTQIFDANNYYNITEVDELIENFVSSGELLDVTEITSRALNELSTNKQDNLVSGTNIKTINNESILGEGNIQVEGKIYSGGSNIEITENNYINVVGVYTSGQVDTILEEYYDAGTVDALISDFTVSGEVEDMITSAFTSGVSWTQSQIATKQDSLVSGTNIKTINNESILGSGNIEIESGGITSGEVETMIASALTPVEETVSRAVNEIHQELDGIYTSAQTDALISSAYTSAITWTQNQNYALSANVDTLIATKQDTLVSAQNIKTINNESILGEGNITIQGSGGGGESVVELTKAQYEALTGYAEDTTYIIIDADTVDLNTFATSADVVSLSGSLSSLTTTVNTKATKQSVTARASNSWYLPGWNAEGVITGGTQIYNKTQGINGTNYNVFSSSNTNQPSVYAPTGAGIAGQPLLSNGSGAPVWGTYKFQFISQSAYDALTTKDANTIYFIIDSS